ncbi:MAG: hypothetical protein RI983_1049 [Bacteroidota bacterium]|jgi:hydroxymethylglutaryl-CoA lyase
MKEKKITLVECPRDAMQGWKHFIPTQDKIKYLNALLKVGFDVLDCGSFVSAKAIPQMADTAEVIASLNWKESATKLLVIVANERGAEEAVKFDAIRYLGFPFSISPSFQLRNTNSTLEESFERVKTLHAMCEKYGKELVIYLSMGFGNPYGDSYGEEILFHWANQMTALGIRIISLADTVGVATPDQISSALQSLIPAYPEVEFGVHLHADSLNWKPKMEAALAAGCHRFDGAIKGIGGCPMAQDELVGNMDTEKMIGFFAEKEIEISIDVDALQSCSAMAVHIFQL